MMFVVVQNIDIIYNVHSLHIVLSLTVRYISEKLSHFNCLSQVEQTHCENSSWKNKQLMQVLETFKS